MNCSCFVTVWLGRHRSIATSARAQARSKAKRITGEWGPVDPGYKRWDSWGFRTDRRSGPAQRDHALRLHLDRGRKRQALPAGQTGSVQRRASMLNAGALMDEAPRSSFAIAFTA